MNDIIGPKLLGVDVTAQSMIDKLMLEMDGTENKDKLGANAILGVSVACAKAGAIVSGLPLYQYVGGVRANRLPVPLMNVLNGGAHANNGLDVQEFMIVPMGETFRESLRMGSEVFTTLKKTLNEQGLSTGVGDEGGFAPVLKSNEHALELLQSAIEKSGYKPGEDFYLALDVAATELYENGKYRWEKKMIEPQALLEVYKSWRNKFPLFSVEDGFSEDDWNSWKHMTTELGSRLQIVGDDLFVTNPKRLARGIEEKAANALLVKINQIGSLTETGEAVGLATRSRYRTVMSHRSGETEDTTIADLAVGFDCSQIKTGSLCRSERIAKYNQLLRIEEELGAAASYWGAHL